MELSGLECLIYGFLSGLTEIFPVSARAHSAIMLKVLGAERVDALPVLLVRLAVLVATFLSVQAQLVKMARARKLARIPKKRRKRPLDLLNLINSRFLFTMVIPLLLLVLFYGKIAAVSFSLLAVSGLLFVNGIVLYIPQFLPGSNKDARSLSRVDGFLMGLGEGVSVIPGLSGIGAATSVGSVLGVERDYALNMSLMANLVYLAGMAVYDIAAVVQRGVGQLTFQWLLVYILTALLAFAGAMLAIRIMRKLAAEKGYAIFSYYCWGIALFTFILNLMA